MSFSKIIGHKKQIEYLQKLLKNGHFAHAYLFSGPKYLGKNTIAQIFLEEITQRGIKQNLDATIVTGDETIAVEEIRQLRDRLALSALGGGDGSGFSGKIALIDNAEQMTSAAQNALLKTLEEPRGDTLIILVSHHPDKLLETIKSRCVNIAFHPVGAEEFPEGMNVCAGRPGMALSLEDEETREAYEALTQNAETFLEAPLWKRINLIEKWVKEKQELPLMQWELLLHDRLLEGGDAQALNALLQLHEDLAYNSNKQLALQHFARCV
ncbi:AAA family ATPase [Candidatus Uhrbacteria bacterium]|jgi:DNA polymerase III delta prime subunit|nr:AAA family ATPase [Candidatus Uhrbacteria bacterium]